MADYFVNLSEMGKRIKSLRLKQGKTQAYFADMLFISPSYLALIEGGKRTITVDVLAQITRLCDVSADYLLFGISDQMEDSNQKTYEHLTQNYTPEEISKALQLSKFYLQLNYSSVDNTD